MHNHFESKLKSALNKLDEDFSPGKDDEFDKHFLDITTTDQMFYHSLPKAVKVAISGVPDLEYEQIKRIYKDGDHFIIFSKSGKVYEVDTHGVFETDREDNIDMIDFGQLTKPKGRVQFK